MHKKYSFIGSFTVVVVVVCVCVSLCFGVVSPAAAYDDRYAGDVRVLYGLFAPREADIWLNDTFAGKVASQNATDVLLIPPGEVRLRAFEIGTRPDTAAPIFDKTFEAQPGQHLNVAVVGIINDPAVIVHDLLCDAVVFGEARVSVINAVYNGVANSVTLTGADGTIITLADTLRISETANLDIPAGRYTLNIPDLLTDYPLNLSAGLTHTLYILGDADVRPAAVRQLTGPTVRTDVSGYLRFVNAVETPPAVDVYVNDTLFGVGMAFGSAVPYFAVKPGNYTISVYEAGQTATDAQPLVTETVNVRPDVSVGVGITQIEDGLSLFTYTDDRSTTNDTLTGFAVYNATDNSINVELEGQTLLDALEPGTLSERIELDGQTFTPAVSSNAVLVPNQINPIHMIPISVLPDAAANLRVLVVTKAGLLVLAGRALPE